MFLQAERERERQKGSKRFIQVVRERAKKEKRQKVHISKKWSRRFQQAERK